MVLQLQIPTDALTLSDLLGRSEEPRLVNVTNPDGPLHPFRLFLLPGLWAARTVFQIPTDALTLLDGGTFSIA